MEQKIFLLSWSYTIWKTGLQGHAGRWKREMKKGYRHFSASAWSDTCLFTHRPLAKTSHMTSASAREDGKFKEVSENSVYSIISAA